MSVTCSNGMVEAVSCFLHASPPICVLLFFIFSKKSLPFFKGTVLKFNKTSASGGEGYANIDPNKGGNVEGALYTIPDSDIIKLDRFEGYPLHYDRVLMQVQLEGDQVVEATVYVAQPSKVKEGLRPTRKYINHLLAGRDILSPSYYRKLEGLKTLQS